MSPKYKNIILVALNLERRVQVLVVLTLLGAFLVSYGVYGVYDRWQTIHKPTVADASKADSARPSEAPLPVSESELPPFKYVPEDPKVIRIPAIAVEGYIQNVTVDRYSSIGAPSNINLAGWYTGSVKPGENGLSIIDGHVQGRYKPGIFKNLANLNAGDEFSVEFGDRSNKDFLVVSVNTYTLEQSNEALFALDSTLGSQLNLITCGGKFNKSSQTYEKRVIVVSKPI